MKRLEVNLFDYVGYKVLLVDNKGIEYRGDATDVILASYNEEDYGINEDSIIVDTEKGFIIFYESNIEKIENIGSVDSWV